MPGGKQTTFEWTCSQCGAENRVVDSQDCPQCGKPLGDEKCLRHFKLTPETGFYGFHHFRLPESWKPWRKKLARQLFNKFGYGGAIIRGKAGRPKK